MQIIQDVRSQLLSDIAHSTTPRDVMKSAEFKKLYSTLATLPASEKAAYGKAVNDLKNELESAITERETSLETADITAIDVTAPWHVNENAHPLLSTENGSRHPLTTELDNVIDIFTRMGFAAIESRQIDDDFHMFGA